MPQVRTQKNRVHSEDRREADELEAGDMETASHRRAVERVTVEDIDDILDDIDLILEENVLEVLIRFVQKGGE